MKCINCGSKKLYTLKNGHLKCAYCRKKFSLKKVEFEKRVIELFCEDLTALECSKKLGKNYVTIQNRYMDFRYFILEYLDKSFEKKSKVNEYDEYIYLEKNKRKDKKYIFEAKNFLSFDYDNGLIYSLSMPELSRFKESLLEDELDEAYYKKFTKYLKWHRVSKLKTKDNNIQKFWLFFENFINKYKGINPSNFILYLKEAEFKYNFSKTKQIQILKNYTEKKYIPMI